MQVLRLISFVTSQNHLQLKMYSLSLSMSICSSIILLFLLSPYSESKSNYGVNQIAYEFWSNPTLPSLTNITYEFCQPTTCGGKGPVIRFPFRLNTQPVFCGLKGFELSCSSNNNTLLHLPSFNSITNDFYVQEISYLDSSIAFTDPNETTCPVKTLFSLNFTSFESPFLRLRSLDWNIATLNCSEKIEQSSRLLIDPFSPVVGPIDCISDDKFFFYVIWGFTLVDELPPNCSILSRSKLIPGLQNTVENFLETGRMEMAWEALDVCQRCEKFGNFCGFNFTNNSAICVEKDINVGRKKRWIPAVIAVGGLAATIVIGIILVILFLFFMRRRRAHFEEKFLLELMNETKEIEIEGKKGFKLKVYSVSSIKDATNCFSDENKLGEGGYGPVYKGLFDGQEIAIKRLSRSSRQGLAEFKKELIIVAKLQHTNLVQLLGFCIQGEEKMLVYEFMPHNSLDSYIFDQSKRKLFNWNKYFSIIEEIAQGILYLHKYSRLRIIHRDLKASNILLDNNMNPKISDFGMARIFTTAQSEANTNRIVGTHGYMAPEYAVMGIFSTKSDVFSYGVLVLEIVSGRRSNINFNFDRPLNLIGYAWMLWKEDAALEIMHPALRDSCSKDRVLRCINVALLCVEDNPLDRPSMAYVISMLTSEGVELPMPKQPAFCIERRVAEVNSSTRGMAENHTINNLTVSVMTGR